MTPLQRIYEGYHQLPNLRAIATHEPVLGEGPADPVAVLVGEAPGRDEVFFQRPFVGRAGERLNTEVGDFRKQCWVTNIVKFRPIQGPAGKPKDRTPYFQEVAESMPYFWRELSLMAAPHTRFICAMGKTAASAILQADVRVSEIHGKWGQKPIEDPGGEKWLVYVTYHPAAALHNPDVAGVFAGDMRKFVVEAQHYQQSAMNLLAGRV
jgi:uracil-DNA glycosylase family 4